MTRVSTSLAQFRSDGRVRGDRRAYVHPQCAVSRYPLAVLWDRVLSVCAWPGTVVDRGVVVRGGAPPAMELREMSRAYGTAEETAELLPQRDSAPDESYFIEYAMQKEMINRNRCSASRRLLSQSAQLDFNFSNSNHSKVGHRWSPRRIITVHDHLYPVQGGVLSEEAFSREKPRCSGHKPRTSRFTNHANDQEDELQDAENSRVLRSEDYLRKQRHIYPFYFSSFQLKN